MLIRKSYITYGMLGLALIIGGVALKISTNQMKAPETPYNIILIISDQETYKLASAKHYKLPAHEALKQHGITFTNHYTAAAMCSPSRAALLTGVPPQTNGVFDQMEYSYVPNLDSSRPNMGSILKKLGYQTAYFGKFEMDKTLLAAKNTVNYSTLAVPYGFDVFNPDGDVGGEPQQGYQYDTYFVGEAVRWLHQITASNKPHQPFFIVISLLNPHDIMYGDANLKNTLLEQKPLAPVILPPPATSLYAKEWNFSLPETLDESLKANGMPNALEEYQNGWSGALGFIPTDRKDMWSYYYNYYLNAIQDNDRNLQLLVTTMNELDLWKNTIVISTADHGEMGGAHGGLRGKGPFAYEENSHIPLIIDHPGAPKNISLNTLTSHIDLLPTLVGLTGISAEKRKAAMPTLPGHDFSALVKDPARASLYSIRPGILFNYVGISTIDGNYLLKTLEASFEHKPALPSLTEVKLDKRGFLAFVFNGRYKFARYYAPNAFNTPKTLEQIFQYNDVQLFDLKKDPNEKNNLAIDPQKNAALILEMNNLLNELLQKEVGINNGAFLPTIIQPK